MEYSLNGSWRFRECGTDKWSPAVVPGCNYLDLMTNGVIPDPFLGTNEKDAYWVGLKDWEYIKDFELPDGLAASDKVNLSCKGLDTICDVFFNGKMIGRGENAHLQYEFNIKPYLRPGKNEVLIRFFSPVLYVRGEQKRLRCPRNNNGQTGIPSIRKPQCHFGWDWGPVLPPSGIQGDITIVTYSKARVTDIKISQTHADGKVRVDVKAQTERYADGALSYVFALKSPAGAISYVNGTTADAGLFATFLIEKPQLWWTNDLSDTKEQPLYTVSLELLEGTAPLDRIEKKIGLRTIVLNREQDQYGQNCQFVLNGKPLFIKGANWIPSDSFITREDRAKLQYYIDAALFSHMNMFRIWGGGYYGSDLMYELCDRYGILLWQDFQFACQAYPFFEEGFRKNVAREVEYNVKRIRHHASLALWCGNNEIEQMTAAWAHRRNYVKWTEIFFYHILPELVTAADDITPYVPGSPFGTNFMENVSADHSGDTHLWEVWHGLRPMTYYRERFTRFCSEFGFESLPDLKTVKKFAGEGKHSLTSPVFNAHQKCKSGNLKMVYYISTRFRLPSEFEDYVYLSQITQQECIKDAVEHWRRNKGRCNGAIYWQYDDCWPVCSWASVDYYGSYKALMYTSRHFNAPYTLSIENWSDRASIYVINDTLHPKSGTVRYALMRFDGAIIKEEKREIEVGAIANVLAFELDQDTLSKISDIQNSVLVVELHEGNNLLVRKTALFLWERDLALPAVDVRKEVSQKDGCASITLVSDKYARLVSVESKTNHLPLSDNFFDLLPGESYTVTQPLDRAYTDSELKDNYTVKTVSGVPSAETPRDLKMIKRKVFSKPLNMILWLIYKLHIK